MTGQGKPRRNAPESNLGGIWASPNEVDEPRACYTEWSKSERERQILYTSAYIWNLERWCWGTCWKSSNGHTDIKNRLMDMAEGQEGEGGMHGESNMETHIQFSSVTQSCPTLRDPMNRSTPGLPVHHQLLEFTQTHVHRVSDAIQPSHPLSSPSPPAPYPSQHQSLFQWVNSSHEVAKVLEFQLQHHSLQRNPRADLLQNGLVGSPCSPRDSKESSPTPQFKSISLLHSPTLTSIHDHWKAAQSCPTLCKPMDYTVHVILQARTLE